MENKKVTKREYFGMLRDIVEGNEELVKFIDHELSLLDKKSNVRTKAQKENDVLVEKLYEGLAQMEGAVTISDIIANVDGFQEFSNQKVSALLKKLRDTKRVVRTMDKKKAYFSIAEDE